VVAVRTPSTRTVDLSFAAPIVALAVLLAIPGVGSPTAALHLAPGTPGPGLALARPDSNLLAMIVNPPSVVDVGTTIAFQGAATGGTPPYEGFWGVNVGNVVDGMAFTWNFTGSSSPVVVWFEVRDHGGSVAQTSTTLHVVRPPELAMEGMDALGDVGVPLPFTLTVSGGVPPFRIDCTSPNGSSTSVSTATEDGNVTAAVVPESVGPVWVVGTVTDADERSASAVLPVGQATALPVLVATSVPSAEVGYPTAIPVAVEGGVPPFAWSTAALAGVSDVAPSSGSVGADGPIPLTVTFDGPGTYELPVSIVDATGLVARTNVSVNVSAGLNLTLTPSTASPDAGAALALRMLIGGGIPPYAYRISLSDNEGTSGTASASGPLTWSATPVAAGYLTVRGVVTDATGRSANVTFTIWVSGGGAVEGSGTPASSSSLGGIALASALAGAVVSLFGAFAVRRWLGRLRGPAASAPSDGAGPRVVREILAECEDGIDRATLELLAEERHVGAAEVAAALATWQRAGRVRVAPDDDGHEVVRWVPPASGSAPVAPPADARLPGDP
jgi:hypothetical protein